MNATGIPIVLSAPSGTGKTSLCDYLREHYPSLCFSTSHTTREPRRSEMEGRDYFFISQEEFDAKIKNRDFLEWVEIHGNRYGTARDTVENVLAQGDDLILELDVQGVETLKNLGFRGVFVLIMPPSLEELARRLRHRGTEPEEKILKRLEVGRREITKFRLFDYILTNHDIGDTAAALLSILQAEKFRAARFETECPEIRKILDEA